jgi:type VI secretion system secreted protein Hcp
MTISAYLKLDGIQGECKTAGHEGEIELRDWRWGSDQVLNIGSQSSGVGAGKIKLRPLVIVKAVDTTSPALFVAEASGRAFLTGHLSVLWSVGANPGAFDYLKLDLKVVAIKSIALSPAEVPVEEIEIEFGSVKMTLIPEGADGQPHDPVSGGWDAIRNVSWS